MGRRSHRRGYNSYQRGGEDIAVKNAHSPMYCLTAHSLCRYLARNDIAGLKRFGSLLFPPPYPRNRAVDPLIDREASNLRNENMLCLQIVTTALYDPFCINGSYLD